MCRHIILSINWREKPDWNVVRLAFILLIIKHELQDAKRRQQTTNVDDVHLYSICKCWRVFLDSIKIKQITSLLSSLHAWSDSNVGVEKTYKEGAIVCSEKNPSFVLLFSVIFPVCLLFSSLLTHWIKQKLSLTPHTIHSW
jgi:hypothetical protein